MSPLTVTHVGGPTTVLEIAGLRLLVDPTFDPPGRYPIGDRALVKTTPPALPLDRLGRVDAVLLSHDQHPDNLDTAGRALLADVPVVLTTETAAGRLDVAATGLAAWSTVDLDTPDGGALRVTGLPARHGPDGTEHLTGPVTGFLLSGDGLPTVYVSGDNASLDLVRAIAERCPPIDVAILFAGAARTPLVDGPLTLTSAQAAEAARTLGAGRVVPVHTEGWEHFTEGPASLAEAFRAAGLADRLVSVEAGQPVVLR